jgi:CP family cyanate transporter-like MFS transporter
MAQSIGYLLAATGPLLFGALHDSVGSWTIPMIVLLLLLAAQLVIGSLAARNKVLA